MSELFMCPNCKDTYFVYDDKDTCNKCGDRLVEVCDWCAKPESECKCGKDDIKLKELQAD